LSSKVTDGTIRERTRGNLKSKFSCGISRNGKVYPSIWKFTMVPDKLKTVIIPVTLCICNALPAAVAPLG
jgi:hypothetical protein